MRYFTNTAYKAHAIYIKLTSASIRPHNNWYTKTGQTKCGVCLKRLAVQLSI